MKGPYPYYGPTGVVDTINTYRVEGSFALIGEDGDHFLKFTERPMTQMACGKFNVNNHAHILEGTDECTSEWFFYYFMHRDITPVLTRQGAGRYKLTKGELEKLPILLPPLREQQRIVTILRSWDHAADLTARLIAAKQDRKRGLMQQLLIGRKRFQRFVAAQGRQNTSVGSIPADWRYVSIGEVAHHISERNSAGKELPVLSCTKHQGLVDSLAYFGRQIFSEDTSTYKMVRRHQFAYATNHIEEGSIGYQDLYNEALISPMYTVFETGSGVNDRFLYALLKTEMYRQIFERSTSASVDRRGSLRWNEFSAIKVPLPSQTEQAAIVEVLDACDQDIALLSRKLALLKQQKQGLMQQLLTGKVRVAV